VGITVLAEDEAPISKVQGNARDANEEAWVERCVLKGDAGAAEPGQAMEKGGSVGQEKSMTEWGVPPPPCFL